MCPATNACWSAFRAASGSGTIPYFMSEDGGLCTHDKMQVVVLPEFVTSASVKLYATGELPRIPADYRANGFSYIVIPAFSDVHQTFAKECSTWPGFFDRPLVGWIAGIDLKDLGGSPRSWTERPAKSQIRKRQ